MFEDLGVPALDLANDRVMPCGGPAMLRHLKRLLESRGFHEWNTWTPGDRVIDRLFTHH